MHWSGYVYMCSSCWYCEVLYRRTVQAPWVSQGSLPPLLVLLRNATQLDGWLQLEEVFWVLPGNAFCFMHTHMHAVRFQLSRKCSCASDPPLRKAMESATTQKKTRSSLECHPSLHAQKPTPSVSATPSWRVWLTWTTCSLTQYWSLNCENFRHLYFGIHT